MDKLTAFGKLTQAGTLLISKICPEIEDVRRLTAVDIGRILSLQDRLSYTSDGKWIIAGKKKGGGQLNFAKFRDHFFQK